MTKLKDQQTAPPAQPVTRRQLPLVNCAQCDHPLPYEPGKGNAQRVLTEHYNKEHLDLATALAPTG